MQHYVLGDVITEISERENNPSNSEYERFVGLEHYVSGEVEIENYGSTANLNSAMKVFNSGDILVARRNVYLKRASVVYFDGLTSGDSIVLRPKNETIGRILPFILNTDDFWDYADQYSDGTMSKRLSPKVLKQYEFDLPDDNLEQLADILWAMVDVKKSYQRLLKQTDELVKSQFIEMFGDLVDNQMGWPIRKLSDVAKVDGTMTKEYEKYADYPHIGIDSIEKNTGILSGYRTVQEDNVISPKYYFGPQHILYSKIRPALNKVALPDFEGLCSADCYPLLVTGMCDRKFLAHVMRSDCFLDYVLSYSGRSQMPKVNRKQLEGFSFPCPPIELQKKFTVLIDQSDKSKFIGFKSQFIEMFGELGKDDKGWGITTLGECCELNPKRPRDIDDELLVSFVPMPAVSEDGKIDCSDIKPYKEVRKGFTYFAENDVLFAKITPCMENGKGAVAKGLEGGIGSGSTEFHVLRPIAGKSNPYWLYILTMFESFRVGARKVMTGTGGQLRVPIGYLNDYPITLPPIDLQDRFEEFVHQSDKSK